MTSSNSFHTFYQDLSLDIVEKLKAIKLVVLDVDGSISDGGIFLDRNDNEQKKFNCKDGMGISLLIKAQVEVALLTGRNSPLTARRAQELQIKHVIQGKMDKEESLLELLTKLGIKESELAVLGDDINDLPLYEHAAIAACPKDGYEYMQSIANVHLTKEGGKGAARELADLILMAKGLISPQGEPLFLKSQKLKLSQ